MMSGHQVAAESSCAGSVWVLSAFIQVVLFVPEEETS